MRRRALLALALAHSAQSVVLAATFTGALVAGVVVHANVPAVRRVVTDVGNRITRRLLEGTIVIGDVQSLSLGPKTTVHVREAEVLDPEGHRVLHASDVEATLDLERLLASVVKHRPPDVDFDEVRVGRAEVVLDVDAARAPRISRAFRTTDGHASAAPSSSPPARSPRVHVRRARVSEAHVHGDLVPPELDGDASALEARFLLEDERATLTLDEGRVVLRSPKAPKQRAPLTGAVAGALAIDLATSELDGNARLDGSCGGIPVVARAAISGETVEATVDVEAEPAAIAAAFSDAPPMTSVELHARAQGKLPTLGLEVRARVGASNVVANGELDLREGNAFKLDVEASHMDAAAFGAGLATDVSGTISSEGTLSGAGGPLGQFRVTTADGVVASQRVPAATIEGRFDAARVTAIVRAREPGVELNGKLTLDVPERADASAEPASRPLLAFDLQARSSSLRALARAPNVVGGAASARVQGTIDLDKKTIRATTTASADDLTVDLFAARRLSANGTISGPLDAPRFDVGFAGVDLRVQAKDKAPLVYPSATGHATIALVPSPRVLDASIHLSQPGATEIVTASAKSIHLAHGAVEARGLRVTGLGEPLELDANVGKGQWYVRAKGAGVDLHRAARMIGVKELELLPEGTNASIDVDVRQGKEGADGHLDVVIRSGEGVAEAHATIAGGTLRGTGKVAAEGFGHVEVARAELDLPDRLDARSLQRTTGIVELRGAVDLARVAPLFAGEDVAKLVGLGAFEARIERGDPEALPAVRATFQTRGFGATLSGEPRARTIEIAGIDGLAHVAWDGRTEDAEVALLSWDEHGLLGSAGAKAKVPLAAWATGAAKLDGEALARLDVRAIVDVPAREVSELPPFLEAPALRGTVESHFELSGAVDRPEVVFSARTRGLREDRRRTPGVQASFDPLDGSLEARWDGERAAITFTFDERARRLRTRTLQRQGQSARVLVQPRRKPPGHFRGLVLVSDLRMRDVLRGRPLAELPWRASAELEVDNLALSALRVTTGVTGALTGRARLKELNGEPSFEVKAHVDDFGAGGARVKNLDLTAGGRDASLFAHASIVDDASQATIQLASQSLRMKGLDVSWEATAPTRLDYAVQNGRLALLAPFVKSWISEMDGRIDGAGSVTIDRTSQVFEGGLALQDANLYVNVLGEEITSLDAIAKFERTGIFRIDNATGKMGSGEFRASASGRMSGFLFMDADATIIATKNVPLSAEGATFASATGEVKVAAKMSADRDALLVTVDVPRAEVQLPDRSTQSLQALAPDPTVAIGVRRGGELDTTAVRKHRGGTGKQGARDAKTDEHPLVTRMTVVLGNAVELEGRGIAIALGGRTLVEIADELKVTGRLDLRGGTIEVHGRRFTVDRGTVTFPEDGEPSNPTIVAAAYWDSPDRTRVWVEFAGPLKTGTPTLRSEPPFSKNEILSVLLFGRPDPNMAAAGTTPEKSGDTSSATAIGSGFVAGDLNRLLSEIDENLDIETDTLSGNRTRTKLGRSFFDRRLKVQVGYAPGRTTYREPDTTYLFLNWQFIPKWALVATRGDRGTTIFDVLFQHRY